MPDRAEIACAAAEGLRRFAPEAAQTPVLLGFDGFVDSIIHVVDQRPSVDRYMPIQTIEAFGARISAAAGQSSNFELVTQRQKLGGNGPIMANALAAAGVAVTYAGAIGNGKLHPVFTELAERAEVFSLSEPGYTDALEFTDGKLMLGKYEHLGNLDYARICEKLGEDRFHNLVARSHLVGMVNWTMLAGTQSIWEGMIDHVLPKLGPTVDGKRRMLFVDLCDPAKRPVEDLIKAMRTCTRMNQHGDVILGLNLREAGQVLRALGLPEPTDPQAEIEATAVRLREALDLHAVVVHPRHGAAGAVLEPDGVHSACFYGPFVRQPKLSTGAGDNFNAGFCLGRLADLPVEQALCVGTATSGYYVRHAASPTLEQVAGFCDALPEPEPVA